MELIAAADKYDVQVRRLLLVGAEALRFTPPPCAANRGFAMTSQKTDDSSHRLRAKQTGPLSQ